MINSTKMSTPGQHHEHQSLVIWSLVFLLVAGAIHSYIPHPLDADTAYHAAVGRLISTHGILHAFPWTPFSWLSTHYADKELLFHLLFVPLSGIYWETAARIVGTLTGTAALLSIFFVLRSERVAAAGIWTLVPLAASYDFLYRFALVRPHLLSIALSFIVLWAATRGRLKILAIAAAIYPFAYVAWQLPLILVCIAETARLLASERMRWKPAAAALAGMMAGVLIHPNTANLLQLAWIQIVKVLMGNAWGARKIFDLGTEFLPPSAEAWSNGLLLCLIMIVVALVLSWRNRRNNPVPLAYALTALAFGIMTVKTVRFVEYFVPFSVAACALGVQPLRKRYLPHAVLAVSLLYTVSLNAMYLREMGRRLEDMNPGSAAFLQDHIPSGAQVFSPDWLFTGTLMLALPDRRFIVALDPSFFYEQNPDLYLLWFDMTRNDVPDTARIIRNRFNSQYVICQIRDKWHPFISRLSSTPGVKSYTVDDLWLFFDLRDVAH